MPAIASSHEYGSTAASHSYPDARPSPRRLMRFVLYARKSTDREDKQIQSIGDQTRLAEERAEHERLSIVRPFTESRSAKFTKNRPEFAEMIRFIEKGRADAIICWHPDRLARNAVDGGWIIDLLDRGKLKDIVFVSGYHFENSPEGKLMLSLIFSQAKYQVDKLSVDVSRGMASKRSQGGFPHRAPEGYLNDRNSRSIVPDPMRFPLLRSAADMILSGTCTPAAALAEMNGKHGYRTRPSDRNGQLGAPMSRATFYDLLARPFYVGLCSGPQGLYRGTHQPLLSAEEFDRIQRLMGRPSAIPDAVPPAEAVPTRPQKHDFAFTGLMRCGRCGCAITATQSRQYTYYHCTNMRGVCDRKGVRAEALESQIMAYLRSITIPEEMVPMLDAAIDEYLVASTREREQVDALTREAGKKVLAGVEGRLSKLLDLRLSELVTDDEYLSRKAKLMLETEAVRQRIEKDGSSDVQSGEQLRRTARQVIRFCAWAEHRFSEVLQPQSKRQVVRLLAAEGKEPILTEGRMLLEPRSIFTSLSVSVRDFKTFKQQETGFQRTKETLGKPRVSSGGPYRSMFGLCSDLIKGIAEGGSGLSHQLSAWERLACGTDEPGVSDGTAGRGDE